MIHIHRVYTKSGDKGKTTLVGGLRIDKTAIQVEAYGCIDELQSYLGVIRSLFYERKTQHREFMNILLEIERIQNNLFDLGSLMASSKSIREQRHIGHITEHTHAMETFMDVWTEKVPPLNSFILSGEGILTSSIHFARALCRSVERQVLRFHQTEELPSVVLIYFNRLSDFLFVLARYTGFLLNEKEVLWVNGLAETKPNIQPEFKT